MAATKNTATSRRPSGKKVSKPKVKEPEAIEVKAQVEAADEKRKGAPSRLRGQVLIKAVATNPRRPGTYGWRSWEAHVSGQTFEEFTESLEALGSSKTTGVPGGIKHIRHETDLKRVIMVAPDSKEAQEARKANGLPPLT